MTIVPFIAKVQNTSDLIGQEEYNIGRIALSISILQSEQKSKTSEFGSPRKEKIINQKYINN